VAVSQTPFSLSRYHLFQTGEQLAIALPHFVVLQLFFPGLFSSFPPNLSLHSQSLLPFRVVHIAAGDLAVQTFPPVPLGIFSELSPPFQNDSPALPLVIVF